MYNAPFVTKKPCQARGGGALYKGSSICSIYPCIMVTLAEQGGARQRGALYTLKYGIIVDDYLSLRR